MIGNLLLRILYKLMPESYYENVAKELKKVPGKRVLDVGSGAGHLAKVLRDKEVVGLDVDLGLLKMASGNRVLGSACFSPFRDSGFDLVIFHDSLHHLERPFEGLGEAWRILKADGLLAIFDFDRSHFLIKLLVIFEKLLGFPATFLALEELLNLPGFKPIIQKRKGLSSFFLLMKKCPA